MAYDFIIIGGGSAGSVLANRLSENGIYSVCLIEAGGDGKDITVRAQMGTSFSVPGLLGLGFNNWQFNSIPQSGLNGRIGYQPRGKALGGSSAINASLYIRGHSQDYDDWANLGCGGWDWNSVLPYFRRCENNENGTCQFHGNAGPLQVRNQPSPNPLTLSFVEAGVKCGLLKNEDFNGAHQEGVGLYQVSHFHSGDKIGERCSAAAGYLHPVQHRRNLHVFTHSQVKRLRIRDRRAVAIEGERNGKPFFISANREIIISAGAIMSPQLLLLSGIGPSEELERHGIRVVHDLPGVGKNLQDHLNVSLKCRTKQKTSLGFNWHTLSRFPAEMVKWIQKGNGYITSPHAEGAAFFKTDKALLRPDIQVHFCPALYGDHGRQLYSGYGVSIHACLLRPYSRGEVKLQSSRFDEAPHIDPGFLSDDRDLPVLVKGLQYCQKIVRSAPLAAEEMTTKDYSDDRQWQEYIRNNADTIYHPVGTCKMGIDALSVVNEKLQVHGLSGLRVADASIMPTLIGGNTNAPGMMIGEKASDMILEDNAV